MGIFLDIFYHICDINMNNNENFLTPNVFFKSVKHTKWLENYLKRKAKKEWERRAYLQERERYNKERQDG